MACAPSKDSDQPGHLPSLISLRCPHEERSSATHWVLSEDSDRPGHRSAKTDQTGRMRRLIWVFAGRTVTLLVLSWGGWYELFFWPIHLKNGQLLCEKWSSPRGTCKLDTPNDWVYLLLLKIKILTSPQKTSIIFLKFNQQKYKFYGFGLQMQIDALKLFETTLTEAVKRTCTLFKFEFVFCLLVFSLHLTCLMALAHWIF